MSKPSYGQKEYERGFIDGMQKQMQSSVDKAVNGMVRQWAQPEQEPVATVAEVHMSRYTIEWTNGPLPEGTKLYTTPPQPEPVIDKSAAVRIATALGWEPKRKPLTDVEIWNTYKNLWMFHPAEEPRLAGDILKFARAIEAAHGIKE